MYRLEQKGNRNIKRLSELIDAINNKLKKKKDDILTQELVVELNGRKIDIQEKIDILFESMFLEKFFAFFEYIFRLILFLFF